VLRNNFLFGFCIWIFGFISAASSEAAIFEMNCGANGVAYPLCGFDNAVGGNNLGTIWNRTFIPGGGPNGRDAVQIELLPRPTVPAGSSDGEGYYGWTHDVRTAVPQGQTRYIRVKLKLIGPIRYVGNSRNWGDKIIILGDGCDVPQGCQSNRIIMNLRDEVGNTNQARFTFDKNISGVGSFVTPVTPDMWHSIQIKVQSSSGETTANGRVSLYFDGDNASEATPTTQSSLVALPTLNWDKTLALGYYGNYMADGGHVVFQFAGFEYDDRFDPTWHTGGTSPVSACDLNSRDGVTVADVQLCANQAIEVAACGSGDINQDRSCTVVDVQRVVNAALGGLCVTQ
jgi:hypothetical protein